MFWLVYISTHKLYEKSIISMWSRYAVCGDSMNYTSWPNIQDIFFSRFRSLIALRTISPSDIASHWSFAYYNGIVGNTSVADGALILHMIT